MAKLEKKYGINASYYFRIVKESNHPNIIEKIVELGHEIGYHYEDLTINRGDIVNSIKHYKKGINYFRNYYNIKTICMHGSPTSKWDNRLIWDTIDYKDYGIIGEPYFDIDYKKVYYLTDTGRKWNNLKVSIRDKVNQKFNFTTNKTHDIILYSKQNILPNQIMINCHPQRWSNSFSNWIIELVLQSIKNPIKRMITNI